MLRLVLSATILAAVACSDSPAGPGDGGAPQTASLAGAPVVAAALQQPAPTPAAPIAAPAAPAKGAVTGKVTFEGTAPERAAVDLKQDKVCVDLHASAPMLTPGGVQVGAGGGLKDCFVQLTGVPDTKYEAPATAVTIDQVGCTYVPHVFGVMKKQPIKILNSDATLHNIHAMPKTNREFNFGMPDKGMEREEEFKKAEEAIHIKCDVHPWMSAFCFTMEHPFFAVTGDDGSFSISLGDLPDGEYGVKVWHETLGEATGKVTVKDGAGSFEHVFKK